MFAGSREFDQQQQPQNRVKVEDALSYLDQVKTQFSDEPNVYTQFLDIMKEFKSQAIDTPGVIRRVSQLFHGRPNLIMGFNTFLPVGFKVRVEGNRITIKEPSGTTQVIEGDSEGGANDLLEAAASTSTPAMTTSVAVPQSLPEAEKANELPAELKEEPMNEDVDEAASDGTRDAVSAGSAEHHSSPVALNTAIDYVNTIKRRFADRPEVYKEFLDILYSYQSCMHDKGLRAHAEKTIIDGVERLFAGNPDLRDGFRSFLPQFGCAANQEKKRPARRTPAVSIPNSTDATREVKNEKDSGGGSSLEGESASGSAEDSDDEECAGQARSHNFQIQASDLSEMLTTMTIDEAALFENIRRMLSYTEFGMFLHSLSLMSTGVINGTELLHILLPNLGKFPALYNEFHLRFFPYLENPMPPSKPVDEEELVRQHQIDYSSCKQFGVSYRSLPDGYPRPSCSGRTPLCESVLNDTWVSFPSWASEDSTCVSSKKTQYEEFLYRTEDERYEIDIVIEVNKYAIESLEGVRRRMNRMSTHEQEKFRLDDSLGGSSESLMRRAIKRIYGEHAYKVFDGLRCNPRIAVPKVIERMRDKERDWQEAQEKMNAIWREQNEKYVRRALDHHSALLKTNDTKWIRSRQIIQHLEQLFDERLELAEQGVNEDEGPHMTLNYPCDRTVLSDVTDLVIHFVKRQSNINGDEKRKIKKVLRRTVTEWFFEKPEAMSDDEDGSKQSNGVLHKNDVEYKVTPSLSRYRLVYGGNSFLVFLRTHQILCHRLGVIKKKHKELMFDFKVQEDAAKKFAKKREQLLAEGIAESVAENVATVFKCHTPNPCNFYDEVLAEVKSLLDGQVEQSAFEESIRAMFPQDGYLLHSVDKLVSIVTSNLRTIATNGDGFDTLEMFERFKIEPPPSITHRPDMILGIEGQYAAAAEVKMAHVNCFKVFFINEEAPLVTIELIDTENAGEDDENEAKVRPVDQNASEGSSDEEMEDEEDYDGIGMDDMDVDKTAMQRIRKSTKPDRTADKQGRRLPIFLRRNRKQRKSIEHIGKHFVVFDGLVVANDPMKLASNSWEGLWRRRRPPIAVQMRYLEFMNDVRRKRAANILNPDLNTSWLNSGAKKTRMYNPQFPFLQYNKYTIEKETS